MTFNNSMDEAQSPRVTNLGTLLGDAHFAVTWPDGTQTHYVISLYLARKLGQRLHHGAHGQVANWLKKYGRRVQG